MGSPIGEMIELQTDVLVLGGGLAGCFAAIKAAEQGASVVIFEKSHISRSGNGATGLHRIPLIHPDYNFTYEEFARLNREAACGIADEDLGYEFARDTLDRILDLESYGIQVRDKKGEFDFWAAYDICMGDRVCIWPTEKGAWNNIKPILAGKATGFDSVRVFNRVSAVGLMTADGLPGTAAVGAVGLENRTGRFVVCNAKAVVLTSGGSYRLGRHKNSAYAPTRFVECGSPANSGEGQAMAFRAGAELVNMEFAKYSPIWKDFSHWGPGPIYFTARFIGGNGQPIASFKGAEGRTEDFANSRYGKTQNGQFGSEGPIYHDASNIEGYPEEKDQMARVLCALENESTSPGYFLWMKERGEDFLSAPVEFEWHPAYLHNNQAGVYMNPEAQSTLSGLFCAGDVMGGGWRQSSGGGFVFGARAGQNAAIHAKKAEAPAINPEQIQEILAPFREALDVDPREGYSWIELEDKARMIASEYGPPYTSDDKLKRGLLHLERIKERYLPRLYARGNPREMMRVSEVRAIFQNTECFLRGALFRKESRHAETPTILFKNDYPQTDDQNWLKHTVLCYENGEIRMGTRDIKILSK